MSASRLPLKQLSAVCRSLATTLHAGVPILKAVSLAGGKSASPALKKGLEDIDQQLRNGSTLAEAFRIHDDLFPDLMCDLVGVAERTGMLPEVFRSLADHYDNNQRLRKDFIGQITWPV